MASGADVNARDRHGQTALMIAAHRGHAALVQWLVEQGAELDHTAKYGLSALMFAALGAHTECARTLVEAGADLSLRGTGAPGFAGRTALDLAIARGDSLTAGILHARGAPWSRLTSTPHFTACASWAAARALLTFDPIAPADSAGVPLIALRVHVRDHQQRALDPSARTLEAHYAGFVLSQARKEEAEARRLVTDVPYGPSSQEALVNGHVARVYPLGPEPPPDDVDGRSPAVVVWCVGEMFYLIASSTLDADVLMRIALSTGIQSTPRPPEPSEPCEPCEPGEPGEPWIP